MRRVTFELLGEHSKSRKNQPKAMDWIQRKMAFKKLSMDFSQMQRYVVAALETVKSLQMEPQLKARYSDYLAEYMRPGFAEKMCLTFDTPVDSLYSSSDPNDLE
jgi:hypothetical protein